MSVKDVLEMAKKNKVEIVDFKFIDVPGLWQHFSIPATDLDADKFEQGLGFDGSSIRGFQWINESDMILIPDPDTAMMDPFTEHPTMSFVCNVLDAITRQPYSRDPRYITQKAEKYLNPPASPTPATGVPRSSFSSSTAFDSTRTTTKATIISTPAKGSGTPATPTVPISATRSVTKKVTFRSRPWTSTRICVPRWCST